jgi:hypothetical protein
VSKRLKPFDKYQYYLKAVQSPDTDAEFLQKVYSELRGKNPRILREDFCGSFAISCEWAKRNSDFVAIGVDMDPEPLRYGGEHYLSALNPAQQTRVKIIQSDVLNPDLPEADIVAVFNFSSYFLKSRETMVAYMKTCLKKLRPRGVMVMDAFGGPMCEEPNVDEVKNRGFIYYWEQTAFDPISRNAQFYIHFKRKGEKKRERVFSYNWRMWTIPELRDCMRDAGFSKTHVYWEGSGKRGEGNGVFKRREKGEVCGAWVCYVVGEK